MSPILAASLRASGLMLFLCAEAALACSPKPGAGQTPADKFKGAEAVFVASAVPGSSKGSGPEETVALRVLKVWKGKPGSEARYAQKRFGTCGFSLKEGATYLIFASRQKDAYGANAFSGTGDIQHSVPTLRALIENEKQGKFSGKVDTTPAKGESPGPAQLAACEKEKDPAKKDSCFSGLLACSWVAELKLKESCYGKARALLADSLQAGWLN